MQQLEKFAVVPHINKLRVGQIVSRFNPRKTFEGMDELVASIKESGILTPLLVRPEMEAFDLIAGGRRLKAAMLAGLEEVPVRVLDCSAEDAEDLRIIDNAQRVDVHPMEEAEAYSKLLGRARAEYDEMVITGEKIVREGILPDFTGEIARRVGKSRAHVAQRLVLVNLPENARAAFREKRIDHEIALLIARIPDPKLRDVLAKKATTLDDAGYDHHAGKHIRELPTAAALRRYVQNEGMLKLSTATFDRKDVNLVPKAGACGPCPMRTGNDKDLFGDVKGDETCTNPGCFRMKLDADFKRRAKLATDAGFPVLSSTAAKKVFGHHGTLQHGCGFVDPDAVTWRDGKEMTNRKRLGKNAPGISTLIQDENGLPRELWTVQDFNQATKAAESKSGKKDDGTDSYKEENRKAQKKAKLRKAAKYVALDQILEANQVGHNSEESFLLLLLSSINEDCWNFEDHAEEILPILKGKKPPKVAEALKGATIQQLRHLVIKGYVGEIKTDWKAEQRIEAMVEHQGWSWKDLEKVAIERAEAQKISERETKAQIKAAVTSKKGGAK